MADKLATIDGAFRKRLEELIAASQAAQTHAESKFPKGHGRQVGDKIGPSVNSYPGFAEFVALSDVLSLLRKLQ